MHENVGSVKLCNNKLLGGRVRRLADRTHRKKHKKVVVMGSNHKKAITRRAFTAGAASAATAAFGALFLEPVAGKENTFWLPWETSKAYASETTTVTIPPDKIWFGAKYFEKSESSENATVRNVAGVKIHIKSFYNGKEADVTTDDTGGVFVDLLPLARKSHSDAVGDFYEFDACVSLTAHDCTTQDSNIKQYREVVLPRIHICQGQMVNLPLTPDEGTSFYFRSISFDDWDILYTNQEFVTSPGNTLKHVLKAELYFPEPQYFYVQAFIAESPDASRKGNRFCDTHGVEGKKGEFKTIYWESEFLNPKSSEWGQLQAGEKIYLNVADKNGNHSWATKSLGLTTYRSPCDDAGQPFDDEFSPISSDVSYGGNMQSGGNAGTPTPSSTSPHGLRKISDPEFHLPVDNMPKGLQNLSFSCWAPSLPVVFRYDPIGYILFGLDLEIFNYSNAEDEYTGDTSWRSQPRRTFQDQCDRKQQQIKNRINDYKQMKTNSLANGKAIKHKSYHDISLSASFQMLAQMTYNESKTLWEGDLSLMLGGGVSGSFTEQFVCGIFPFYVKFELSANVSFGALWGIESSVAKEGSTNLERSLSAIFSGMHFKPNDSSTALDLQLGAALTLAIGVDGLASAGVRGSGGISFTWQWRKEPTEKEDPRLLIGAHVEVAVFGEILGFRKSWTAWTGSWPALYDSDASSTSNSAKALALDSSSNAIETECSIMQPGQDYYMTSNSGMGSLSLVDASENTANSMDGITLNDFVIVTASELTSIAEVKAQAGRSTLGVGESESASASESEGRTESENSQSNRQANGTTQTLLVVNDFTSDTNVVERASIVSAVMHAPSGSSVATSAVARAEATSAAETTNTTTTTTATTNVATNATTTTTNVASTNTATANENGMVVLAAPLSNNATYSYEWTDGHKSSYNDRGTGSDVIWELGNWGVKPRTMNMLAKDVFSAAHCKLININGARYLFRIAPVVYSDISSDDKVRMRVVYQRITDTEASAPYPVEYDVVGIDVARGELYDYDFDVRITSNKGEHTGVLLMIISGTRPNGNATSLCDAYEATYASAVKLKHRGAQTTADQGDFETQGSMSWGSVGDENTSTYYAFRTPKLMVRDSYSSDAFDRLESDGFTHELGFFMVKRANTKEDLLNPDAGDSGIGVVHFVFSDESYNALEIVNMGAPTGTLTLTPDSLQNAPSDAHAVFATMGFSTKNGCGVRSLKLTFEQGADNRNVLKSVASAAVANVNPTIKSFCPWDSVNTLIAAVATNEDITTDGAFGYLARVTLPPVAEIEQHVGENEGFATLSLECVSPKHVPLGGLKMRAGHKYCYYASNHSGVKGYDYDEDAHATSHVEDPSYVIKAFAEVNGVFTNAFVFAQCDYPLDSLFATEDTTATSTGKTSFVTRHVTSAESSKANLYSFDVPFLRCVSVDALVPVPTALMPGATEAFSVTLTNKGNTVITQVKLCLSDAETHETLDEVTLDFDQAKNTAYDGLYTDMYDTANMSAATQANILVAEHGDAVLIPGQTRSFTIELNIPASWIGCKTKDVRVTSDSDYMSYIDPNTGEEVTSAQDVATYDASNVSSLTVNLNVASEISSNVTQCDLDGEIVENGRDNSDSNAEENGGLGSPEGSGAAPRTGDAALGALTPALVALGAASAGFAAYSARRTRLEHEAAEAPCEGSHEG